MTIDGYMNRCDCGNLYLPTGRSVCPPCRRVAKDVKNARLAKLRQERKATKKLERERNRKTKRLIEASL